MSTRTYSTWQRPLAPTSFDVAIVGGGIMGCATAYWLRQFEPSLNVVLVEAEQLAYGASGRNAGFLLLGTHTDYASAVDAVGRDKARRLWSFTAENARLVADLPHDEFDFQPVGSMIAAGDEAEAARLSRSAELLNEDGMSVEFLDAATTNERVGGIGFFEGLYTAEGGMLNPAKLVRHLASQSKADVLENWPVQEIESGGEGVQLAGPKGEIQAKKAVLTLNAYLPKFIPALSPLVRPVRAQMLATEPVSRILDHPVYSHEGYYYIRQRTDGRVLLGGARHLHREEEVGYEDATTDVLQSELETYLATHFPNVGAPIIERRWSGTMGFSPDSLPVIGAVPGLDNTIFATGFTGHGMGFSVRFGQLLANQVLGQGDQAADLFDAKRFDGKP